MSNRDTQFIGFACRLLQELLDQCAYVAISPWATGGDSAKSEQLIAQRVYDLVKHAVLETHPLASMSEIQGIVDRVPDMAELPEEQIE